MSASRGFWLVVGLALSVRAVFLLAIGPDPRYAYFADTPSYTGPAISLKNHGAYATLKEGKLVPELNRTPGYPLFLVPFLNTDGSLRHRAVQWIQAILNALSAGLVYGAAFFYWRKDARTALLSGIAMAVDFVNVIHCAYILTDILFVFFVCLSLYGIARRQFLLAGAATAASAFVRPVSLYLAVLLAALLIVFAGRLRPRVTSKQLAGFMLVMLLPLAGWYARNQSISGQWTFSTVQDSNLFLIRTALVEMRDKGVPFEQAAQIVQKAYEQSPDPKTPSSWAARYLLTHWSVYAQVMFHDFLKLFAGNSIKVATWMFMKDPRYDPAHQTILSTQTAWEQAKELIQRQPVTLLFLFLYMTFLGVVYLLAILGMHRSWMAEGWRLTLLIAAPVVYFTAVTLGADAQARYRLPIMPALFLFAGGGYKMAPLKERDL